MLPYCTALTLLLSVEAGTLSNDDEREDLIARITIRNKPISQCVDLIFDTNDVIDDYCVSEVVAIPFRRALRRQWARALPVCPYDFVLKYGQLRNMILIFRERRKHLKLQLCAML